MKHFSNFLSYSDFFAEKICIESFFIRGELVLITNGEEKICASQSLEVNISVDGQGAMVKWIKYSDHETEVAGSNPGRGELVLLAFFLLLLPCALSLSD